MYRTILNNLWGSIWKQLENENITGTQLPGMSAERIAAKITCPFCLKHDWKTFPYNTSAYDLQCMACFRYYQIKANKNLRPRVGSKDLIVMGATYTTTRDSVGYICYILISYTNETTIRNIYIVDANNVSHTDIVQRGNSPHCNIVFKKGMYRKLKLN